MTTGTSSWRGRLVRPLVLVPVIGLAALLGLYFVLPVERTGVVGIRLLFDGADRGRYPNGTRFSAEEIISLPVLRDLHAASEVARRVPFEDFASSYFVSRSSRDLESVHREFRARLADTRISPVDRARLEEEYRARLAAAGGEPELLVGFRQPAGMAMSDQDIRELLDGVLRLWVSAAEVTQGVFRYDIDVPGPSTFDASGSPDLELLVGLDGLRLALERLLESLEAMTLLPGTSGTVVGDERISSDELRASIMDLLQLRVRPALALGLSRGLAEEPTDVVAYFEMRSADVARRRRNLASRVDGIRRTLAEYSTPVGPGGGAPSQSQEGTTLMPQMNEAFLDRLFALAGSANDVTFRQQLTESLMRVESTLARLAREEAYYADMRAGVTQVRNRGSALPAAEVAQLRGELTSMNAAGKKLAERLGYFYAELSRMSLRNSEKMYEVSRSVRIRDRRAVSWSRFGVAAVAAALAGIGLGLALERRSALRAYVRRRSEVAPRAST